MPVATILDTNVFNHVLDATVSEDSLGRYALHATHVQWDELERTPEFARRAALVGVFNRIAPTSIPTAGTIWGVSRWGRTAWGGPVLGAALTALVSANRQAGKKARKTTNEQCDALVISTAIENGLLLISDDAQVRAVCEALGGEAITLRHRSA